MEKHVFVADSTYSLFLYLLQNTDKIKSTFFILGPSVSHADVPNKWNFQQSHNEQEAIAIAGSICQGITDICGATIKNCHINAQSIGNIISTTIAQKYPTIAISDGLSDLQNFPKYLASNQFISLMTSNQIAAQSPLLQTSSAIQKIDIKALWSQKTEEEKQIIGKAFHLTPATLDLLSTKKIILVTQPLSEDEIVTEEQKQAFYRDIMQSYPADEFVIKPHPREKTDWNTIFPNAPVISRQVPMELLSVMAPIEKLVTFFSTAGTDLIKPENVDFYSKNFEKLSFVHPEKPLMGKAPYANIEEKLKNCPFNWLTVPDPRHVWYPRTQNNALLLQHKRNQGNQM